MDFFEGGGPILFRRYFCLDLPKGAEWMIRGAYTIHHALESSSTLWKMLVVKHYKLNTLFEVYFTRSFKESSN